MLLEQDQDIVALRRGTRLFLWTGLVATIVIIVAILMRQGLFRQTVELGFLTNTAQDLSAGMPVKIAGFRVGSVHKVALQGDGKVSVRFHLDADHMGFVTRDAVVELRRDSGLLGTPMLEIVQGTDKKNMASEDAMLTFVRTDGLATVVGELRDRVIPVVADMKNITGGLADTRLGIQPVLAQLREVTASLNTLLATSNRQAQDVGQSVADAARQAERAISHASGTLEVVNARLPALLDKTQRVIEHVENISAEAEASLPAVMRDGAAVTTDVRDIVEGAKNRWPIREWVNVPGASILEPDSDPRAVSIHGRP